MADPSDSTSESLQSVLRPAPGVPKPGITKMSTFHARPFPPVKAPAPASSSEAAPIPAPPAAASKEKDEQAQKKEEQSILDSLERESKEWDKDAEIARILNSFALDAYSVLGLQPGVPESTIIATYRKKSLLIHPDKTSNPSAPAAFDKLKKAQTELLDEKARGRLDEAIADARMLLMRDRGLTKDSEEMRPDSMTEELKAAWRDKTKVVLVDNEMRRRKQLKAQMAEEGREQKRQDDEAAERKRKREADVAWENSRNDRINSWRAFATGTKQGGEGSTAPAAGVPGKKKKPKMKVLG